MKLIGHICTCSFVKVGAMVFLCHDINDIFMEGAKMARYADHGWLPTALFAVFMLSWFASRIYYFPVYVIRSVYYEPTEVRCRSPRATLQMLRCLSSVPSACALPPQLLRRGCRSSIKLHCCRCQRLGPDLPPACWGMKVYMTGHAKQAALTAPGGRAVQQLTRRAQAEGNERQMTTNSSVRGAAICVCSWWPRCMASIRTRTGRSS
jgi:hypothetical protein